MSPLPLTSTLTVTISFPNPHPHQAAKTKCDDRGLVDAMPAWLKQREKRLMAALLLLEDGSQTEPAHVRVISIFQQPHHLITSDTYAQTNSQSRARK